MLNFVGAIDKEKINAYLLLEQTSFATAINTDRRMFDFRSVGFDPD